MYDGHNAQTLSYNPSPTVLLYRISVLLRAVHSQRETHRILQPQDQVQPSPLPRKPPHYVPRKKPLWWLRKELCFGAETLQTSGCYILESLVNNEKRSSCQLFQKIFSSVVSLKQQAKHQVLSCHRSVCLVV